MERVSKTESGNVLFLILIAVALFAALSYAVTSSTRSGAGSTERESLKLKVAKLENYFVALDTAITRLLVSGCELSEISFEGIEFTRINGNPLPSLNNPNAPIDEHCHVFSPYGGAVPKQTFYDVGLDKNLLPATALMPGSQQPFFGSVQNIGSQEAELMLFINLVGPEICKEINRRNGIVHSSIPIETCSPPDCGRYTGTFPTSPAISYGDQYSSIEGNLTFCTNWSPSGWSPQVYYINHVLVAR